ncbi:MAG: ABC transporter substrate-binding protein [Candidatus Krumholzibacteria bacterium]|nr:ABC transporter substrate-binding protein [Candidatus Krumholzibacteria bacterium]
MVRFLKGGGTSVPLLLVFLVLVGMFCISGCGSGGRPGTDTDQLTGSDLEQAERLFFRLTREHSLQRDGEALAVADAIIEQYPTFVRNDEVLYLATDSAARLGNRERALDLTDQLLDQYPGSPKVDVALVRAAELAVAAGDSLRGAGYQVSLYDRNPVGQTGPDGQPIAAPFFSGLDLDQLTELVSRRSGSAMWPYLRYLQVERMMAEDRVAEAEDVVVELESQTPENVWTLASRDILGGGSGIVGTGMTSEVQANQVGVICPLTGRYAVLGNAFYDAALLALEVNNSELGTSYELKVEDSEGDPVVGALAARRLCREEGSIALLGALMSDPTAAAAIVADQWQTPLVSPTATNKRIWELGEGIFQTNLTGLYETRMLAALATTVMLKKRFGLMYPDTPEGRGYADVFRTEVENWGGEIVAEVSFPSRGTDFKDPIQALRRERPEVLFIPASVDQMVLLGPQLDFYHAGSLVLGLSNWNSEKLRDRSATVLERAIFPNDLALFPAEWTSEFRERWNGENYPREASTLALKSYQATRMLLDTIARSEATSRVQLTHALRSRLVSRDFEAEGPDSFAGMVRMFRAAEIISFPGGRFAEAWGLTEGVAIDSLLTEPFEAAEAAADTSGD